MTQQDFGPDVTLDQPAYIDPTARIFGKVSIGRGASLWPYAVIRAENHVVVLGERTNLQDGVIVHVGQAGTHVGAHCSIGHRATLHGCTIEDNCLVGVGATLMDNVVLGRNSIVAGHAFLTEGTVIPANSVVMGTPGKVARTANNFVRTRMNAHAYWLNALAYAEGRHRAWSEAAHRRAMAEELKRLQGMAEAAG